MADPLLDLARAKRDGQRLAAGIYALDGEMHVDLDEFIVAAGGNPDSADDQRRALEVVRDVVAGLEIPVEVREHD